MTAFYEHARPSSALVDMGPEPATHADDTDDEVVALCAGRRPNFNPYDEQGAPARLPTHTQENR